MVTVDKTKAQPQDIKIHASQDVSKGVYANSIRVSVNDNEAILDLAFIEKEGNRMRGELVSKVVTTPAFAKRLAESILKTLEIHLKKN